MSARQRNTAKRLKKLSAPANDDEIGAFYEACKKVDVEPADTLRKLAKAFEKHVDEHGWIAFPIKFTAPDSGSR